MKVSQKKSPLRKIPEGDIHAYLQRQITHEDLRWHQNWVLQIKRSDVLDSDENQFFDIDLKKYKLPANSLFSHPQNLIARPDLVIAIVLAAQLRMYRCEIAKTRHEQVSVTCQVLVKFLEFLWLNDILYLQDVTSSDLEDFPALLSRGWIAVLRLEERSKNFPPEMLSGPGCQRREYLAELLSTNYRQLNLARILMHLREQPHECQDRAKKHSQTTLIHDFLEINLLWDIPKEYALQFVPFPDPVRIGTLHGAPPSRTENMDLDVAVDMLFKAYEWLYTVGPHVIALNSQLVNAVAKMKAQGRKLAGTTLLRTLEKSAHKKPIEEALGEGARLTTRDTLHGYYRKHDDLVFYSFREVVQTLMTACFVIIAIMNARRRDEIQHKKIGIREGDLEVIDADLGLYVVNFWIEKSLNERMYFYVNQVTHDAIKILEKIHRSQERLGYELPTTEPVSLFSYRRPSQPKGFAEKLNQYKFRVAEKERDAALFMRLAIGTERSKSVHPQMFRRFYGTLMINRYEHGGLHALNYQYGQMDLDSTRIYCTDPRSRSHFESIPFKIGTPFPDKKAAFAKHLVDLEQSILDAGDEKMLRDIAAVLDGGEFFGGYPKLIRRLHLKLTSSAKFIGADGTALVSEIFGRLKSRQHFPKPYVHSQCMAGNSRAVRSAKCYSDQDKNIHQENASPKVCNNCIFQLGNARHIENLRQEVKILQKKIAIFPSDSALFLNAECELENLKRAIELFDKRADKS